MVQKEQLTDDEDLEIVKNIYDRFAINFHAKQKYFKVIDNHKIEEIVYATDNI